MKEDKFGDWFFPGIRQSNGKPGIALRGGPSRFLTLQPFLHHRISDLLVYKLVFVMVSGSARVSTLQFLCALNPFRTFPPARARAI